jgi:hypothetical protein
MMSLALRRTVILGMLALFIAPILVLGISPADRVHGLAGPFTGAGANTQNGGL